MAFPYPARTSSREADIELLPQTLRFRIAIRKLIKIPMGPVFKASQKKHETAVETVSGNAISTTLNECECLACSVQMDAHG